MVPEEANKSRRARKSENVWFKLYKSIQKVIKWYLKIWYPVNPRHFPPIPAKSANSRSFVVAGFCGERQNLAGSCMGGGDLKIRILRKVLTGVPLWWTKESGGKKSPISKTEIEIQVCKCMCVWRHDVIIPSNNSEMIDSAHMITHDSKDV